VAAAELAAATGAALSAAALAVPTAAGTFATVSLPAMSEGGCAAAACAWLVPGMTATESPRLAAAIATRLRLDV
jgi:hypothetical protein